MSYTALYRKWRPFSFADVKGQEAVVRTLQNQITSQRIGHAYLFCGTRGTGKTSIAKIFAKAVNCERPVDGSPCNECRLCRSIASASSLNVAEIDAASNNGVENIREIREQVQYPPTEGKYRVYIIDEVHMLSTGAFNALLKTLEEPPSYVIFILATTEVHKIPITVLSRVQRYDFKRITVQTIVGRLKELAAAEQIEAEDRALQYIARAGDGSMRDAVSLLDQCVAFHFGKLLTFDNVLEVLGAVDTSVFSGLLQAVAQKRTVDCIRKLDEIVSTGRELGQFVTDFIWHMRNLLLLKTTAGAEDLLDISEDNLKALREEAGQLSAEALARYIRIFSELSAQLRYATQKRVLIEVALMKLATPEMEQDLDSVLERLERLEDKLEAGGAAITPDMLAQYVPYAQLYAGGGNLPDMQPDTGGSDLPNAQMHPGAGNQPNAQPYPGAGNQPSAQPYPGAGNLPKAQPSTGPAQRAIPKAQLADLNWIRNEWGKITRELGGSIRSGLRDTILEPAGDSTLCIVFSSPESFAIGNRPRVLGDVERYVEQAYGKAINFKARIKDAGERLNTIYVSDEEVQAVIHMEITTED